MHDSFIEEGQSNVKLSCVFMLVLSNLVPEGPNGQLHPYFIKLIVQSTTGSLGKEGKSFMTTNPAHGKTSPHYQPIQKVVVFVLYCL